MTLIRNAVSEEGKALGAHLARFCEQELSKRPRTLDERCATCAFRPGTLANGSPSTQMDVAKCLFEQVPFHCHTKGREDRTCQGYDLMKFDAPVIQTPWEFSKGVTKP